jgi:hypothetical protein
MPPLDQPMSTWVPAASAVLNQHPPIQGAERTRNRLVIAGKATRAARTAGGLPPAAATGAQPRLSTVHQVKGDQAEAVLLLIPASEATDRTMTARLTATVPDPETAKALRVMYVGVDPRPTPPRPCHPPPQPENGSWPSSTSTPS